MATKIKSVLAREVLDSRGFPTVQADVILGNGKRRRIGGAARNHSRSQRHQPPALQQTFPPSGTFSHMYHYATFIVMRQYH